MSKDRLHPNLTHHIVNTLGWPSLRTVQEMSIDPVMDGANTVILAPTAGGKTEAAFFPIISRMLEERWDGLSILYLSPIKALLNNQRDRLEKLFGLVGYEVGTWHGDISQSVKKRIREEPPHVLLTTPESLEGMLISTKTSAAKMFGNLRVVVIDEVHAFAGDDRGWHLLGVLHRLTRHADRDLQRIGLSATVGNPPEIADWLSSESERPHVTIDPPDEGNSEPDVTLDWVGSIKNAAKVIAKIHKGERRLVFCDSRIQCEKLARHLRARNVTTYVNHSSLSADERRQTERAFAEGGPGVIVATSALELGIDIGDLDRVIQIDSPYTVASFLQRMGRTGRRKGTTSNMLFLGVSDAGLIRAASLIELWKQNYVEPARPPQSAYHILAQQMLALVLEQAGIGVSPFLEAIEPLCRSAGLDLEDAKTLLQHLLDEGYLFADGRRLGIGRSGEDDFGARNFLELVSVFTTPPVFRVVSGRKEIGEVHQATFLGEGGSTKNGSEKQEEADTPTVILLAGRSWRVTGLDWNRRIAYVEPFDVPGKSQWLGAGQAMSAELARAHRDVLCGSDRGAEHWSKRAVQELESLRMAHEFLHPNRTTIAQAIDAVEIWDFAGDRANNILVSRLKRQGLNYVSSNGLRIRIRQNLALPETRDHIERALADPKPPPVDSAHPMLQGLKFSELLPGRLLEQAGRARIYGDGESELPRLGSFEWVGFCQ